MAKTALKLAVKRSISATNGASRPDTTSLAIRKDSISMNQHVDHSAILAAEWITDQYLSHLVLIRCWMPSTHFVMAWRPTIDIHTRRREEVAMPGQSPKPTDRPLIA